jgi:hypothetical protein
VALATTDQVAEDVGVINALSNKNLELAEKFRRHIADGTEWTTADQDNWLHVRQAIREYKSATSSLEAKPSHDWWHGSSGWLSSV